MGSELVGCCLDGIHEEIGDGPAAYWHLLSLSGPKTSTSLPSGRFMTWKSG